MRQGFFATEESVTIDLDPGYWVEIKRALDFGEESVLEGAAILSGLNADGSPKFEFSLKQQRLLTLALYVIDWNLPGPNGKPVALPDNMALRQEVLGHLTKRWAKKIIEWIDKVRAEDEAPESITMEGTADPNPTAPGDATETSRASVSPNGSAAPTALYAGHLTGS